MALVNPFQPPPSTLPLPQTNTYPTTYYPNGNPHSASGEGSTPASRAYATAGGDTATTGGYYGGNDPATENNLRGSDLTGRYGGTMGGMNNELDRTDAGVTRGIDFIRRGAQGQADMTGLAQGQMDTGAGYGAVGQGYGANGRGDSDLSGADRAQSQQDLDRVRAFYQNGPGPSAAQAQLRQANDINNSATVSLARSGRGGVNPLAARDASFAQANAGQEMNRQSKILGAQEAADWRTQQGQAMGLEQAGFGAMRAGDLNTMSGNLQGGVNAGQLGHGYSSLGSDATNTGQQLGLGYASTGETAAEHAERLRQEILSGQSTSGVSRFANANGAGVRMNDIANQGRAATEGAIGTGIGSLASTVFSKKDEDKP